MRFTFVLTIHVLFLHPSILQAEQFVVWIDADLVKIPSDALGELIGADRDVLTYVASFLAAVLTCEV